MFKTFWVVLEFIFPIMLGILETLKNFNFSPKNVGHSRKILTIPPPKNQSCSLGIKKIPIDKFGKLLRLKIGFIASQNLKQHGKMFRSFLI